MYTRVRVVEMRWVRGCVGPRGQFIRGLAAYHTNLRLHAAYASTPSTHVAPRPGQRIDYAVRSSVVY